MIDGKYLNSLTKEFNLRFFNGNAVFQSWVVDSTLLIALAF